MTRKNIQPDPLPPAVFDGIAGVIRLLGHAQRLRIVEYLDLHGERAAGDIVAGIGGHQAAVSQHLNQMRAAGIIGARRQGRRVFYRLAAESPVTILNCIRRQYQAVAAAAASPAPSRPVSG
ncbi:MAG: helix-turn-helix transcriptional regulator [Lentisphaerae bacterium]|nr:helix-turn-helix transcriptional regulator [Lentisphaerota bacterium]